MAAAPARKTVVKAVLAALPLEAAPLDTCAYRYGPQHSWAAASGETALIIGRAAGASQQESAGSGNKWFQWQALALDILVPDDTAAPTATEDLRTDLADAVAAWLHTNRTLADFAKVARIREEDSDIGMFFADDQQVFRWWTIVIEYRAQTS